MLSVSATRDVIQTVLPLHRFYAPLELHQDSTDTFDNWVRITTDSVGATLTHGQLNFRTNQKRFD